jgi:16S rRNA processing protein RimM
MSPKKIPEHFHQIGILGKTYQLKGGLRFYTDLDEVALSLEQVFIEGIGETDVRSIKQVGQDLIIYLTYALNKETAQKLVNRKVYTHKDVLPEAFSLELIGVPVFLDGQAFGQVVDIQEGLQDLLIVKSKGKEFLIPREATYVQIKEAGVFLEDLPEGLLN